jgi:GntR family transcriptional regulator, transcriptional repressor for pyruvate dehydrogenase complex
MPNRTKRGEIQLGDEDLLKKVIKKSSVSNTVMHRITQAIINHEINPGDELPSESELSASMGVGKSSVREAIKMLSVMGVVESIQGDGTFVRHSVDEHGVNPLVYQMILMQSGDEYIFELRKMFEPAYTLLALEHATDEDIRNIASTVQTLENNVQEHKQTADDDLAFHDAILHATHNPYVIKIGQTMLQLFVASIRHSMSTIPMQAVADHKLILQAFINRDKAQLTEAVYHSFDGWSKMLHTTES